MFDLRRIAIACLVIVAVAATYSNHFQNGFHFDDWHTVTQNPAIRSLDDIGRFFTDPRTLTVLPANQGYRPLVTLSLAVDYWMAGGLHPFAFHASVFAVFLVLLGCVFVLHRRVMIGARNTEVVASVVALFGTAWFGLHPAGAETINYVAQRADVYVALGLTVAVTIYAYFPKHRRWGIYLVTVILASFCKPTALIFPALVILYTVVCENARISMAFRQAIPALGLSAALGFMHKWMTPPSFSSATSPWLEYVATQPFITLHYFVTWFFPLGLTADSDRRVFASLWTPEALVGFAFVILLVGVSVRCARTEATRPISFGLFWFLLTLVPVAVMPLAEVQNDHRMFLPFIGLSLAVTSAGLLIAGRLRARIPAFAAAKVPGVLACVALLAAYAAGTHARNRVWLNEETLWRDVTQKSPLNGRGWMNYGISQMSQARYGKALECFETALRYTPSYSYLHINLGIAKGLLNDHAGAEAHFRTALQLAPNDAQSHYYYGRYLRSAGRHQEAIEHIRSAVTLNPLHEEARALFVLAASQQLQPAPESLLSDSLAAFRAGRYRECIEAARRALALRPGYAEALNNIAAGHQALGEWDQAIAAAREAVRLRPDFQLARNNLVYSQQRKLQLSR